MKLMKLFAVVALALVTSTAGAATVAFDTVQTAVPESDLPGGWIANDLLINFEGPLTGQQLIIELDAGSIHQSPLGDDTPPNPAFLDLPNFEALRWDTFVAIGGLDGGSSESVLVPGAAVDIRPGARVAKFDDSGIDVAWAPNTGIIVDGGQDYLIGRVTLSPDAQGTAFIFSSTDDGPGSGAPFMESRVIVDGVLVPEPASMALAGFAVLGMVAARRRS